jgi:phage baseplate assembly protein W
MNGYSPKLPLIEDSQDGFYNSNKTILEVANQNLKMLVLTNPGERIMDPKFGVGLRQYLFSQNTGDLQEGIKNRVYTQVDKYLPYIVINNVDITSPDDFDGNTLYVSINYSIPSLNISDVLNISF